MAEADPMPTFPIDIQCMRISEWLIQRNHLQRDWLEVVKRIKKESISPHISSLPVSLIESIPQLKVGHSASECSFAPYFACKQVFEYFLSKEGDETDLLGSYSSRNVKTWFNILSEYKKGWLHLGESGYLISNNLKYELPYWRKQKERSNQQIQASNLKINSLTRVRDNQNEKYNRTCSGLGLSVESDFGKQEVWNFAIFGLINEGKRKMLDVLQSDIVNNLRPVKDYYFKFIRAWHLGNSEDLVTNKLLPLLTEIFRFLDSRMIEEQPNESSTTAECNQYGIQIVESQEEHTAASFDTFPQVNEPAFRQNFSNELYELEHFLKQRELELSDSPGDVFSLSQLVETSLPMQDLEKVDTAEISEMLTNLKQVKLQLNLPQIQQAYKLLRSKPYSFRLQSEIINLKASISKNGEKIEVLNQTLTSLVRTLQSYTERIAQIIADCKHLKKLFENEAPGLLDSRRVNIVGEINRL